MKTFVLGLDGAHWELIDPWIEEGDLPNLKRIKEKGVYGDLKSQLPPVTAPNWKCYATGKNPGKLGFFWWEAVDWDEEKVYCPDYRSPQNEEIWDCLNKAGYKTAVINMPTSYPPKEIDGYLLSGGPDAENEDYFYPMGLEEKLEDMDYKVHLDKSISSAEDCRENFEDFIDLIESRFELAEYLLDSDDEIAFFHLTIFYINVLHHFLWDDELVKEAWKLIDSNIGKILERENLNLVIISDHGSNEIENVFNINTWLEEKGFLKIKKGVLTKVLSKLGVTKSTVFGIIDKLGIEGVLSKIFPSSVGNSIPGKGGGLSRGAKGKSVEWDESLALATGQGPIFIDEEKLGEEYEKFRERLVEELENLKNPITENRVVRRVYRGEEIYSGENLDEVPDLVMDQMPNTHIKGEVGIEEVFEEPGRWNGENKNTGLFAAWGPDFVGGGKRKDVSILDITPTILHLYDLPVSRGIDGEVLNDIYAKGSDPFERKIRYKETGEKKKIRSRLKSLKKSGEI